MLIMTTSKEGDLPISGDCGAELTINKPVKEKKHHLQGGYECIFVNDPPKVLQTECPICLCVLKEPYIIDCCGNSFCRTCIDPIKEECKPCPLCNVQFTNTIPDKRLQRTLNELQVYCCHKEDGCEWVGELGNLTQHLNLNFQLQSDRLIGCQLVSIKCTFCSEDIQRKNIKEHEEDLCPERPYRCMYCEEYESTHKVVTANHWPICPSRLVPCPNQCGMSLKSNMLDAHIQNKCPLQVVDCAFKYAGCKERLPRKDMPDHDNQSLALHMSLQADSYQQEMKKLVIRISELESHLHEATVKLKDLEAKNQNQESRDRAAIESAQTQTKLEILNHIDFRMAIIHNHVGLIPFTFTMSNFEQKKTSVTHSSWYSPSFYTHPRGYKMCLRVDPNGGGSGKNSHVSVYLYMMRGEKYLMTDP